MIIAGAIIVAAIMIAGMISSGYFSHLTQYLQSHYPQKVEEIVGYKEIPLLWTPKTRKKIWQFIKSNEDFGDSNLAEIKIKVRKSQQIVVTIWISCLLLILANGCIVLWNCWNNR